ncbi:hypothetical protein ACFSTE_19645 [Aquimarina hainanensis]|uniref:Lipoprotein n=1 Tax=Aquimarina hainanensis TaxID=1578017 RepID=A0ABW5ND77_9FLAO
MKNSILILLLVSFCVSCKNYTPKNSIPIKETSLIDSVTHDLKKIIHKDTLVSVLNFKKTLSTIKGIRHTRDKYKDWMFNKARTLRRPFQLDYSDFKVASTSYTYKKDCVFYLHRITHTNDSISIKPFLENIQGKHTEGYTRNRILLFAMLNDKEANFIDIPEKMNPYILREELLDILTKKINGDVILCDRAQKCKYKNLRTHIPQ